MPITIQLRNDTSDNWTSINPTLAVGEIGIETDTNKFKIGTGTTSWALLGYAAPTPGYVNVVASATTAASTYNIDTETYYTSFYTSSSTAASGFTINVRGDSGKTLNSVLSIKDTIKVTFMNTTGAVTTSYPSSFTIDGVSQTVKWVNGTSITSGNSSSIDVYSYTIVKTAASTYTVFGERVKYA